jgi:DNA-directed RNA polymerase specialized sigma24 family protein
MPVPAVPVEESIVRSADLARAVAELGPEDRLAIHLFFSMDLPLEEVAQAMGKSVPAGRSRLYRAIQRMRPGLELTEVLS